MKVVSFGMGQNIFEENSAVRQRMIEYGSLFQELHLIVFTPNSEKFKNEKLSSNVFLYSSRTKIRIFYLFDFIKIAKSIIKNGLQLESIFYIKIFFI